MFKSFLLIISIGLVSFCFSQNDSTYYFYDRSTPILVLEEKISLLKQVEEQDWYKLIYFVKTSNKDSIIAYINRIEKLKNLSSFRKSQLLYFKGLYFEISDREDLKSFKNYNLAFERSKKYNDTLTILYSAVKLAQTRKLGDTLNKTQYNKQFLDSLNKYSEIYNIDKFKIFHQLLLSNYYMFRDQDILAKNNFKKTLDFSFDKNDSVYLPAIYNNIGVLYQDNLKKPDSAIPYFEKTIDYYKTNQYSKTANLFFNPFLNLGNSYKSLNNYEKADFYYQSALKIPLKENRLFLLSVLKKNMADLRYKQNRFKDAYNLYNEFYSLNDSLNKIDQETEIAELEEKLENEKITKEKIQLESDIVEEKRQQRNLWIGSIAFLLFGGTIFFLIQKNTKRKQLLAEQEKELQVQKVGTLMKEQELASIDAMIEGQEKERQRIANDLHDDLGGMMATVKLHFNTLKDKPSPSLYDKTNALLDEAYQKIRAIAHAKNSGVIAKEGLLKSVRDMAQKVSVSGKIDIGVIDHGLENRLENSLELSIFRMIQELITNVIKHANATEVSIHLTQHDDSLNIMIEDNGKGFNTKQVTKQKGMGLSSIDKRVDHLNGKLEIDSEIGRGTNIIIDIPI